MACHFERLKERTFQKQWIEAERRLMVVERYERLKALQKVVCRSFPCGKTPLLFRSQGKKDEMRFVSRYIRTLFYKVVLVQYSDKGEQIL